MSSSMTILRESETTGTAGTFLESARGGEAKTGELRQLPSITGADVGSGIDFKREAVTSASPIPIDILYQAREAGSKHFDQALRLLESASHHLSEARRADEASDRIGAASEILRFEELLQPLFECRAVGDGFANLVNTIHFGIANLGGEPLNRDQITVLWRIVRELALTPFLSFGDSLKIVRQLKKVGLCLNNSFITEWASEPSELVGKSVR